MCGITGFCSTEKEINSNKYYESHLLIKHRGMDDEGFVALTNNKYKFFRGDFSNSSYKSLSHIQELTKSKLILGHRRLSILDTSFLGHQPICDESQNYYMVYNGEIFNYLELKEELIEKGFSFKTESDTEVLLKAYIYWGKEIFNKLNGMWAFALYDRKKQELILSRDRFGIKPLYYTVFNNVLYFASEMKFIKSFLEKSLTLNFTSVNAYLKNCSLNFSENTFWKEIKELEPGHFATYKDSKFQINKYWTFKPKIQKWGEEEALNKFSELFQESVSLRMRSDVEVGSLLSGGLDSSLIVSILNNLGYVKNKNFKSFSAVFKDENISEKKYITEILKKVPVDPHFIYPEPPMLKQYLKKLFFHIEEPPRSMVILSQFLIYEYMDKNTNVKVLLNGQGADEIFAGYSKHYFWLLGSLLKKAKFLRFLKEGFLLHKNRQVSIGLIANNSFLELRRSLFKRNYFENSLFNELKQPLREYLKYDDRMSMAFGKEVRVPFLDYRLVEFAFSLKESFKIYNFENKKIQRDFAKNILPSKVVERKDKQGFSSPQLTWQKSYLKEDIIKAIDYFDKNKNSFDFFALKKQRKKIQKFEWEAWRTYAFYEWLKFENII